MSDLIGERFGRLVVISRALSHGSPHSYWTCYCDCDGLIAVSGQGLRTGKTNSCGCLRKEVTSAQASVINKTHGMTKTVTHKSWESMKQRCLNPNAPDYPRYGARGIAICERWKNSFQNFLEDMGERPDGMTLDRRETNGNYEPSNCRWATRNQQQRNKTNTNMILWNGELKSVSDLAQEFGIKPKVVKERIAAGWSIDDALQKPNRKAKE